MQGGSLICNKLKLYLHLPLSSPFLHSSPLKAIFSYRRSFKFSGGWGVARSAAVPALDPILIKGRSPICAYQQWWTLSQYCMYFETISHKYRPFLDNKRPKVFCWVMDLVIDIYHLTMMNPKKREEDGNYLALALSFKLYSFIRKLCKSGILKIKAINSFLFLL